MSNNPLNIFKKLTHSSKSGKTGSGTNISVAAAPGTASPKETPATPNTSPTKGGFDDDQRPRSASSTPRVKSPSNEPGGASGAQQQHHKEGGGHHTAAAERPPSAGSTAHGSHHHSSSRPESAKQQQQQSSQYAPSTSAASSSAVHVSQNGVAAPGAIEHKKFNLSDFHIDRTLGTGSFGRVHLVRLKQNNRYYAMKVLKKSEIVRMKQVEHTVNEKAILERLRHPFLVSMLGTYQDSQNIYFFMEYVQGGELFSYLRRCGRFQNHVAKFYAAEVILAFENLHASDIIYRDLKPENLLIDAQGNVKITDFGFAKVVPDVTWTLCGTPDYLAPEIIQSKGYGKAVDWWALGVLIYEMIAGYPPFYDEDHFKLYEKILACKPKFPSHFDPLAKDLVKHLLTTDLSRRYGNLKAGVQDIKRHKWFSGLDWVKLEAGQIPSPYLPPVKGEGDTSQFDKYDEVEPGTYDHNHGPDIYRDKFKDF